MPELPEVETVRRGLNQVTLGQTITGGDVLLTRTIAHPTSIEHFLSGLKGLAIAHWHRRGKYLLAELTKPVKPDDAPKIKRVGDEDSPSPYLPIPPSPHLPITPSKSLHLTPETHSAGWLGIHLRMTGQLLWLDASEPLQIHTRVRLFFAGNRELRFVDQRTFGQMWWVAPDESLISVITGLRELGPEPLLEGFSVEYLARQLQHRRRPIKSMLLDQAFVAGVGNIYADEALFLSGIHPKTLCADLSLEQIERLRTAIVQVLETSISKGGTTFRSFLSVQGINGNYSGIAWVYNREGEPCRICTTPIQRLKLAGRSTHFCPHCQS